MDEELRKQFISDIRAPSLSSDQKILLNRCLKMEEGEFTQMISDSYRIKYFKKYDPTKPGEKNVATGKAVAEIDASAESVLAWRW